MLTQNDLELLSKKGISLAQIEEQLSFFEKGFPYLPIVASASIEKGIMQIAETEQSSYLDEWNAYLEKDKRILKFVPASGAASRMFKDLFEFLEAGYDIPTTSFEKKFFEGIEKFAFNKQLDKTCLQNEQKNVVQLIADGSYKTVAKNLLLSQGLNYGQLPKGLLEFHNYPASPRTAMEEHLVEGAMYSCNAAKKVNVHFTVSPEHKELFETLTNEKIPVYENKFGVKYDISFSEQKSSTDTLAADENNRPFRDNDKLLFRPGGHGALIENLNDVDADIVFIKNIDNVVPDSFKSVTTQYKKLIAGVLVHLQKKIFDYLDLIESGKYTHDQLVEMIYFLQNDLCIKNPETKVLEDVELVLYIKSKLDRPLRVCGMVKNEGEPGGGPFLAVNPDGTISLQILESSQIDLKNPEKKVLFEKGTHFNPVDLVCALKNHKGESYNLQKYIDKNTGFISLKSKNGKALKALELPGLWNGAMSDWNTVFVEVPIETFNPVKMVNDLLRKEHQNVAKQDITALFKASYGLYLLSAKNDEQDNACIINTFLQITSNMPAGCLISVSKQNYTNEMIAKVRKFNLSVLTEETPFELLKRFGYQSGREVDKFNDFTGFARSENGLIYLTNYANAFLSFDVLETIDFDSHTLFAARLTECRILSNKVSMTYDYYQQNVKPKPQSEKSGYRCNICGYVHEGETLPPDFICPLCKHGVADFVKI